jgi:transcriptional regulator with XRE-family HTH domain
MGTHERKTPADPNLALRIKVRLLELGKTSADLARELGVGRGAVGHWTSDPPRYAPRASRMPEIARILRVSMERLMGENLTADEKQAEAASLRLLAELAELSGSEAGELLDLAKRLGARGLLEAVREGATKRHV